jgi:hypothetical protein
MARHATLREAERLDELGHRVRPLGEEFEDPHSGRVGESLEEGPQDLRSIEFVGSAGGDWQVTRHSAQHESFVTSRLNAWAPILSASLIVG